MRIEVRGSNILGGAARTLSIVALVVAALGLYATGAVAGDPSQSDTNLSMSNAAGSFLLQPAGEATWLSGLHVSGFAQQTFGMWQNPSALKEYTKSRNNLAVARTLLQVDENYTLNSANHFFMREWFVYEPPYSFNSANAAAYSEPSPPGAKASWGHFANGFYNQYAIRDAWWESTIGPLNLYLGNQIVVWGQSLAFRVGDFINPVDTTWAFGFANLEQSRIPQWMIHPILNLPDAGPFTSNFLEAVIIPRTQPMWNSSDYADGRYVNEKDIAGSVSNGFTGSVSRAPSGRFDVQYINVGYPGRSAQLVVPAFAGIPDYTFSDGGALSLVPPPISREFYWCKQLSGLVKNGNPIPASQQKTCNLGLSDGTVDFGANGKGSLVDVGQWKIPAITLGNMEEGGRIHTLLGSTELTALYFNTFQSYPAVFWQAYTNQWRLKFMPVQYVGFTGDRPIPMPAAVGEYLPLVARVEAVYANHQPFVDFNPFNTDGVRYSDTVQWMAAADLDQAYSPWLTTTGNLTASLEVEDFMTLDSNKSMFEYPDGAQLTRNNNHKNNINVLLGVGTSWWWQAFAPFFAGIFNPIGRTFLLFPSITLTPPWTNKYFLKLQAIEVMGGNKEDENGGFFKGQSFLTAQFQYNFSLL